MKNYFETKIKHLDSKIENWNNKNFFQRLFTKEKWSDEDSRYEIEAIFNLKKMNEINSSEDFNTYLKYYLEYGKSLSYETSISINKKLIELSHYNPKTELLLSESLNALESAQYYNKQTEDILNSLK